METLDTALVNVYNLLIVTIPSLAVMRHAHFRGRDPNFGRTGVRRAMLPLDRASVSSYRLTIAVWPKLAMQVFGGAVSTHLWGKMWGCRVSELVPRGSGGATLFASPEIADLKPQPIIVPPGEY